MRLLFLLIFSLLLQSCLSKGTDSLSDSMIGSGGEATSLGFVITSILPSAGSTGGNYNISISGSQFSSSTTFSIGGTPCLLTTIISSSSAICKVPPGTTGLRDVVATKGGNSTTLSSGFQYVGPATVTGVAPAIGPATIPTFVTITGTNFIDGATVNVSHPALALSPCQPVTVVNSSTITCYTPVLTPAQSHAIEASGIVASLVVTNPDGTQISLNNSFDFLPSPQFTSVSFGASGVTAPPLDGVLNNGISAYNLTINGNYFAPGITVKIGSLNAPACSYVSASQLLCTSLPVAGVTEANYNLTLTNADAQSTTQSLFFVAKPNIASISPGAARYSGGDNITISGTGLGISPVIEVYNNANTALLGACPIVTSVPLACTTPNVGSAQATTIRLKNDYGYRTTFAGFNFITSISLSFTTDHIGALVRGSNLDHVITVTNTSGVVAATSFTIDNSLLAAPFSFVSTTCGATIAAFANCTITYNFAPTSLTTHRSANITVSYNDGVGTSSKILNLTGWGIDLETQFATINFGTIRYGNNHLAQPARFTKPVVLINRGAKAVTLNSAAFSSGSEFFHTGGSFPGSGWGAYLCGATLAANSSCLASIDFRPSSAGAKNDTYTVTYNGTYTKSVSLTGIGGAATPTTCNSAIPYYDNGSGTLADPWLICSEAHFTAAITDTIALTVRDGIYAMAGKYILTQDITFTGAFASPFQLYNNGNFDGGGFKLINTQFNNPGTASLGLFKAYPDGSFSSINNIQAVNGTMSVGDNAGGLVANELTVTNSYYHGSISAGAYSGGIHGRYQGWNRTINNVFFVGSITCTSHCGGIAGLSNNPVTDSFAHGSLTGTNYIGGIYGYTQGGALTNVTSTMNVTGNEGVGGVVGVLVTASSKLVSYAKVTGATIVGGVVGYQGTTTLTKALFQGEVTASGIKSGGITGAPLYCCVIPNIGESVSAGKITGTTHVGGIIGGGSHPADVITFNDNFSTSQVIFSGAQAGGITPVSSYGGTFNVNRNYVASPVGKNLFTGTGNIYTIGPINSATNGVFYLDGSGPDQTTPVGIYELNETQMQTQSIFESSPGSWDFTPATGKWKFGTAGYPYPILQWLPDTWMP